MNTYTGHVDTFARDNLPPRELWADLIYDLPELQYPDHLNAAVELLDQAIEKGWGDRVAIYGADRQLTYRQLLEQANQVAHVLTHDLGLVPGNRVLLRGPNHPMLAVCWFAVIKAGMIAVTTMPLLRKKELSEIIEKAQISAALCDRRFDEEMIKTLESSSILQQVVYYLDSSAEGLEARMAKYPIHFETVDTSADDTALIAFTSGTTGNPKATMHFHRDVMAICDTFPRSIVQIQADDICIGSPPLGFTFGLGGILLFPLRVGGAAILIEKYTPESYLETIQRFKATLSWTAPFFYKKCAELVSNYDISSLRKAVSAGEALPAAIRAQWKEASGIEMIDGIGATEMLHIFISHTESEARPGATGKPIPGYQAQVIDDDGKPLPPNHVGRLAVKGPTGCRYLADERQRNYVQNGWNITGDTYLIDDDGYFVYQARSDDMIITAGHTVAGPEVEGTLLEHPCVMECAVVGAPDDERGTAIRAYIVLREGYTASDALVAELQQFIKQSIAPYKYPRQIMFIDALPRTQTGKVQRFVLRQQAWAKADEIVR